MEAKDLLRKLLCRNVAKRIGSKKNGATAAITDHMWFRKVNWADVKQRTPEPPYVPEVGDEFDTQNFDVRFTSQPALDSPVESPGEMSPSLADAGDLFAGFTYVPPSIFEMSPSGRRSLPKSPRVYPRRSGGSSPLRPTPDFELRGDKPGGAGASADNGTKPITVPMQRGFHQPQPSGGD